MEGRKEGKTGKKVIFLEQFVKCETSHCSSLSENSLYQNQDYMYT